MMFEPIRQARAFERIATQLREAIYAGKFTPGDKLPTERELAESFKASRAAVRSAVLNLEQSGLLQIRKGSGGGFFVRELDFEPFRDSLQDVLNLGKSSISDLAEARGILEPEAAGLAATRASPRHIERMESSIRDFEARLSRGLPRRPSDFNFHVCVAEGSQNPILCILMQALTDIIFQYTGSYDVAPEKNMEIVSQHEKILNAIKGKDPDAARQAAYEHVQSMKVLYQRYEKPKKVTRHNKRNTL